MKHNTAYTEQMRDWQRRSNWTKRRRYDESAALADEIHYGCQIGSRADRGGIVTAAGVLYRRPRWDFTAKEKVEVPE